MENTIAKSQSGDCVLSVRPNDWWEHAVCRTAETHNAAVFMWHICTRNTTGGKTSLKSRAYFNCESFCGVRTIVWSTQLKRKSIKIKSLRVKELFFIRVWNFTCIHINNMNKNQELSTWTDGKKSPHSVNEALKILHSYFEKNVHTYKYVLSYSCLKWWHSNSGCYLFSFSALTINPWGLLENTVTKSQSGGIGGRDSNCFPVRSHDWIAMPCVMYSCRLGSKCHTWGRKIKRHCENPRTQSICSRAWEFHLCCA